MKQILVHIEFQIIIPLIASPTPPLVESMGDASSDLPRDDKTKMAHFVGFKWSALRWE
jgi:hypothetical protein